VNGTVTLLSGDYDYFHYMQDRFDDSGWGCAYRSLQTLMSWFRKQHYSNKPVLSHRCRALPTLPFSPINRRESAVICSTR
jgi:hypothetical protein